MSSTRLSHFFSAACLLLLVTFLGSAAASWQIQHVASGGITAISPESHYAIPFPSAYHDESQFLVWRNNEDTVITVDLYRNDLYADIQKREYSGYLVKSVCAYRSLLGTNSETRYLVNYKRYSDRGKRQIVLVDLSLDELRTKSTEMTNRRIEPVDICVSAKTGEIQFSAVWHMSNDFLYHFIIELNTFDRIMQNDRRYGTENYYPDVLQMFLSSNETIMALAIWRKGFGEKYHVRYGTSLKQIEDNLTQVQILGDRSRFHVHRASAVNPRYGDRFYVIVWKDTPFTWANRDIPGFFNLPGKFQSSMPFVQREIEEVMRQEDIPSFQITVFNSSSFNPITTGVFGYANVAERYLASTNSIYRIASISKVITAMCIVRLLSNGRLQSFDQRVFGSGGILQYEYANVNMHPLLYEITVEHLLEHTSGGWGNVERLEEERREASPSDFLKFAIGRYRPVSWPGQQFYYSNIGYMILGKVIERLGGMNYELFAQREVLIPLGIYAKIGKQRKYDALWDEVRTFLSHNAICKTL
ncbi:hypothetical protein L596_011232 [Steinernema carpocapsae]|uniref:Beta-lactamase-related domain-containing protein n=2 Tax=Steinernema carpocapsae TaxID=34508 RepID=A0A4U5NT52_STECR|nr:hypothetical protein L596_011232 [Steinernema carpocapsae]